MSRLTLPHYGGKGHYMKCSESLACNGNCGDCDALAEIVEKLAEYEDKEERNPQTNADRIRAMSDEELAEFLAAKFADLQSQQLLGESSQLTATELRVLAHKWYCQWMHWLRQPVKDGEGDG